MKMTTPYQTVNDYIASFPEDKRGLLESIRRVIREAAPEAAESIAYQMPAYKLNARPLVYFALFENHLGFYPTPDGVTDFAAELSRYKQGKGSIQFPLDEPLPLDLIRRMVVARVSANQTKNRKK